MTSLYQLSDWGVLKVAGSGSFALLQGQLTADVASIPTQGGQLTAHCLPNGRVISLFYLTKLSDEFYCIMPRELIPCALTALQKYARFFKVQLTDVSDAWFVYGKDTATACLEDCNARIAIPNTQRELLLSPNLFPAAQNSLKWHTLDIEAGIAHIHAATSGMFLPHELQLPTLGAVSFNKGCYTGQEIIARMQYRGKLKAHLVFAYSAHFSPLELGSDISTPQWSGTVIDLCHNNNETYALCLSQHTASHFIFNQATFTLTDLSNA